MSLDKFSTELVQQVLYEVDLHIPDSREGLRHLSQCSNHYYQLVRPFLFSNLIQNHTHAVPLFLRSILANPSLACYTRKIESSASLAYKISPLSSHTVRAQLEIVIQTASGDDQPLAVKWMDDLFNDLDNYDATTAILFCLLPNLESIRIESYGLSGGYPYIQHVLKTAAQLQEHLEVAKGILRDTSSYSMAKLSMVSLYCHDMGIDNHSFEAMCFLRPRSVQRFFCTGMARNILNWDFTSHVRDIEFDLCTIHSLDLAHMIDNCLSLQYFKYRRCGPVIPTSTPFGLVPISISCGLVKSKKSLKEVVLLGDIVPQFSRGDASCLTNWSMFEKMDRLDVSCLMLTGSLEGLEEYQEGYRAVTRRFLERLPPALRFLRMSSRDLSILPFVKSLAIAKESYTPALEEVVLVPELCNQDFYKKREECNKKQKIWVKEVVAVCKSFGIRLIISFELE